MPSAYAHYRFGTNLLPTLPADMRKTIQRFRQLFDMGLHGPDIFYYASPMSKAGTLGIKYHEQTGKEFFNRVCRSLRLNPSEAADAYLYGVLCHYCLDSACHPFVTGMDQQGIAEHAQMETEFDRYLLELDGKTPPHSQDLSGMIRLTQGECATVAQFYPAAQERQVRASVKNMAAFLHLLAAPEGLRRNLLKAGVSVIARQFKNVVMTEGPNPSCARMDAVLMEHYSRAMERFPDMLEQLRDHMTYNAPLGEAFDARFA